MERIAWIFVAGGVGCVSRHLINTWAADRFSGYPAGTLIVNLVGCFLMALVVELALGLPSFPAGLRVALTTGFLGGLTTYSAFNAETSELLQQGAIATALLNIGVTTAGGLLSGAAGMLAGRSFVGA